jgi:hypothetical protein
MYTADGRKFVVINTTKYFGACIKYFGACVKYAYTAQ